MNAAGDTVVAWLEDTRTGADVNWRLRSVRRHPGGQAGDAQTIASGVGPREPTLSLAIDQAGDAVAVWRSWDGVFSSAVDAARLPLGGSWEAAVRLDADATPLYLSDGRERVSVVADPAGGTTAAWVRNAQGAAPELRASDRAPLGRWTASTPIASPAASDHLAISDDGTTIAAWTVPAPAPVKPQIAASP